MRKSGLSIHNSDNGESIIVNTDIMKGPVIMGIAPVLLPLHIMPVKDRTPHTNMHFLDCACEPNLELTGRQLIIVHNAYDGRP